MGLTLDQRNKLKLQALACIDQRGEAAKIEVFALWVTDLLDALEAVEKQRVEALSCDNCGEVTYFHTKRLCGKCAPVSK